MTTYLIIATSDSSDAIRRPIKPAEKAQQIMQALVISGSPGRPPLAEKSTSSSSSRPINAVVLASALRLVTTGQSSSSLQTALHTMSVGNGEDNLCGAGARCSGG